MGFLATGTFTYHNLGRAQSHDSKLYLTLIIHSSVCVLHLILDSLLAVVVKSLSLFFGWILMYDAKMAQTVNVLPHDRFFF